MLVQENTSLHITILVTKELNTLALKLDRFIHVHDIVHVPAETESTPYPKVASKLLALTKHHNMFDWVMVKSL